MIDAIMLLSAEAYALIGQKHSGWVGLLQSHALAPLQCIFFDRASSRNKKKVKTQIVEHAHSPGKPPLLVFPEGTCVNNEYLVQVGQLHRIHLSHPRFLSSSFSLISSVVVP